ncbi:MAG: discoidin domain-containing protein [Candidatus Hydrogenedentes bacterium]|nr:discoidin domain-containing protein [Candidatus Hydrogenedentota bacterium]
MLEDNNRQLSQLVTAVDRQSEFPFPRLRKDAEPTVAQAEAPPPVQGPSVPSTDVQGEDLEPIKIELPEAFFGGTPIEYWDAHLETESNKPRPPFLAPRGTVNVAKGKPAASSAAPLQGDLAQLTDGDKDYNKRSLIELPAGLQWVQIDLGAEYKLYAVLVWHFHEGKRVYHDIVVQVGNDAEFKDAVTTIYNNDFDDSAGLGVGQDMEYVENHKGRLMDAKGINARYVRLYSQGNTANDMNNYVEVEVFGMK